MKLSTMFPSEYLRGIDIGNPVVVTIKGVTAEQVRNRDNNKVEQEFVMRFNEIDKKLRLNLTMAKECAKIVNDPEMDTDNWVGRKVTIYRTTIKAFGQEHIVPRIRQPERGDTDLTKAVKQAKNGNGNPPAYETIEALLTQLDKDFGLPTSDAKDILKHKLGFTGFTPAASGKMYQAVKDWVSQEPETGEVDELGFGDEVESPALPGMEETQNSGAAYAE